MNIGAMERRDLKYHLGLTIITVAVMALPAGGGNFFGSGGDWYSQHVGAAEALRQTIADSGVIFPQLVNIGGGSNIYDLAYYGLFRPDVMISCLFPGVEMKYFIAVYAAMGFIASVNMMYIWLRGKEIRRSACLMGGLFMAGAACFFHAHYHVMFVSYMPFLILALMGADRLLRKGRMGMAVSAVFLIDAVLMTIFLLSKAAARIPAVVGRCAMIAVMTFSLLVSIGVSRVGEEYLPLSDTRQDGFPFDSQQIRLISDGMYRFDYLVESLVNSNFLPAGDVKKTAMYSSVSNSLYSEFFYDIMKNPISYRNRVILTPGSNVFFNYFMGVRHVVAEEGKVPAGYREIFRHGSLVLAENKNVLPVCYGNYGSPSPAPVKTERQAAESFFTGGFPHDIDFVKARELSVKLAEPMEDKAIILSFRVDRDDGNQSVIIDINGMRNKLAPDSAPYPNENYVFTYVLSSDSAIDALKCRFSAGKYRLRDITVKTAEMPSVQNEAMAEAKESPEYRFDGHTVFKGSIDMEKDGYFVTSWPYKEGYEIRVDGKKAEAEKINRAFLGFPLERGHHTVDIKYTAPGFTAGAAASVISFGIALTGTFYGRWRRR